jgi:DNA-binding Lrp family transcriptional regulator
VKLKTSDVPQADSLALVRRVLQAVATSPNAPVKQIAERTGFSERHVRYRMQAARVLGFLPPEGESALTSRARRLLATQPDSPDEKRQLAAAIRDCRSVRLIAPNLLDCDEVDVNKLAERIARLSGLSQATAERRAVVLKSWRRDVR